MKQWKQWTALICALALVLTLAPAAGAVSYQSSWLGYSGQEFEVRFVLSASDQTKNFTLQAYSPSGAARTEPHADIYAVEDGSEAEQVMGFENGVRYDGVTVTGCSVSFSGGAIEIRDSGVSMSLNAGDTMSKSGFGGYDAIRYDRVDHFTNGQTYQVVYYFLLGDTIDSAGASTSSSGTPGSPVSSAPETADPGSGDSRNPDLCAGGHHSWRYDSAKATCTTEGKSYRVCLDCGREEVLKLLPRAAHTWETRTEQPTAAGAGRTYRICTVCGAEETLSTSPVRSPEEQAAYEAMIALKSQYPDGTRWTNSNYYGWKGGIYSGGYGCAGFAFMLSDAAFGDLPARKVQPVSLSDVRVGDILRLRGDSHSVIVLEVRTDGVAIAEGNMNSAVLWGRTLKKSEVEAAAYLMTRWPQGDAAAENSAQTAPAEPTESTVPVQQEPQPQQPAEAGNPFTDVPAGAYYHDAVLWALENGVTTGVTETRFQPSATCTRGQVVTFLWRAKGCPEPRTRTNPFRDVTASSPFYKAILWALESGITTGNTPTTFNPWGTCTSGHVITFLWRAEGQPAASGSSGLAAANPGRYYTSALAWAEGAGLLSGSAFDPAGPSPRADIVTYLYRDLV